MRLLAALAVLCLAAAPAADPAVHGNLVVRVHGVRSAKGTVRIKVHHHGRDFPSSKDVIARKLQPAESGVVVFEFPSLPHGTYAVVALHDEDDDSTLDRGVLGRPLEGIGFSRGARVLFGPPSFEDAAFELREGRLELVVELDY